MTVEEFDGLVGEGREGLFRAHDGDSAADVAGEGLDLFEGGQFGFFGSGGVGEFFEVEFGVSGDDGEEVFAGVGVGEEGLEDLLGGQADLAGDGDGGEVFGIDLVGAEFVGDAEGVEKARGVGLAGSGAAFIRGLRW